MTMIGMALVCFGVPILVIAIGVVLLWLGQKVFGCIFGGC